MLKLYYSPRACSLASHIALEEAGVKFKAIPVDLAASEQRTPEFLGVNSKGRVPVLITDKGILTENPAILLYIAMTCPEANLAPLDNPFELARIQSFNAYLSSTVHVAHAHGPRGIRWADEPTSLEDMMRKVPQTMTDCFSMIENQYFKGPWIMGSDYTISDMYLFTLANWMETDGVDPLRFPGMLEHRHRMLERPAVKRAMHTETGRS
jgi:glutathione S-transferase